MRPMSCERSEPVSYTHLDVYKRQALTRIDFISAGALLNVLTTVRRRGKQIVFRHPNHLVAELFGVVALKAVASIIFAKH